MINLFEYQNKVDIHDSFEGLEGFLDEIWNSLRVNIGHPFQVVESFVLKPRVSKHEHKNHNEPHLPI